MSGNDVNGAGEWVQVEVGEAKPLDVNAGSVTVEWALTGDWNQRWAESFTPAGPKSGSMGFIRGPEPQPALSSASIKWTFPRSDLENAKSFIRQSVSATNEQYLRNVARAKAEAEERSAQAKAKADELEELERQLNEG